MYRPQQGSLGLVVERERNKSENEVDGLRWYTDFNNCDQILWERYFYCGDLGRDLVPVVKAYKESEECRSRIPGENLCKRPPFEQNTTDAVPEPFNLKEWIERNRKELSQGKTLRLFPESHPCPEMNILVQGESKTELIQRCKIFGKCFLMVISSLLHFCLQFYDITIV
uniref:Uncharacterized protein n=1 Tax=Aplanochytrium stocchinoi TaxID=215587 RepID=A0A7S3V125_9STRA|mmetsp:Transcript_2084/g.2672  ORF Transcript_2084/g.2672 Transcript_2084/m.2672 type:complete len:169 (-) Transcript_2084:779-1285(-)